MDLSGEQCQKLQEAIMHAFPHKYSLEEMLFHKLDKKLNEIVISSNLKEIVFRLIEKADSQGWLEDLVVAARESNSGNPNLKAIAQELTDRGTKTPPELLFDILLQIDFKRQVKLVENVLAQYRTAAFLVHGEPDYGQDLLVTRLFRITSTWKNNSPIRYKVSNSTEQLWKQLARQFSVTKPEKIIDKICERWQTKDVVFIFKTSRQTPPKVLSNWLQEFWEPLVNRGKRNPSDNNKYLLMFLVDTDDSICKSLMLAKQFNEPEYPRIPLYLPPVSQFKTHVLKDWLSNITLRSDLQIPTDLTYQRLWEKSNNGIPQFVYEEICDSFGYCWEGDLAKWLI